MSRMGLFKKKRKPEYVEEILEFQGEVQPRPEEPKKQKKSIAAEFCDQIMEVIKNLEETKQEYKIVTDYLTDIQMIENLPDKML